MTMLQCGAIEEGDYTIQRSLRFRSSASAYLNRTFSGTPQTYTYSTWIKRGILGSTQVIVCSRSTVVSYLGFNSTDNLVLYLNDTLIFTSSAVFRDPSAWYHIVLKTTQSGAVVCYVNNQQVASTTVGSSSFLFSSTATNTIGRYGDLGNYYFDCYLAEVNFIDGQALTPSSFGQTDATTGVWVPKKYTGTYGTNGFYLPFNDPTSATTLAYDKSGNSNNWTANNISLTAGATYDSMTDVPTLTGVSAANYCVLNPLDKLAAVTAPSYANLRYTTANTLGLMRSTIATKSGKWYYEATYTDITTMSGSIYIGIKSVSDSTLSSSNGLGSNSGTTNEFGYGNAGYKQNNGSTSGPNSTFATGDVMMIAYDLDSGYIWWGKNGTWIASGNPATGANPMYSTVTDTNGYAPAIGYNSADVGKIVDFNFGQRPFTYTPPTGFKALNTFNLPDPTIKKPNQFMDATLYTGNGGTQIVTNTAGFAPDLVWLKSRSFANQHELYDTVRGATLRLSSDLTSAESTAANNLQAFLSNGFQLGSGGQNTNGSTYVGWQWKESATSGFDIVTYTGTGVARTVSHSLGVAPKMIILKSRSVAGTVWLVGHNDLTWNSALYLNQTAVKQTNAVYWNNTAPTSSVFTLGNWADSNASGATYVAYLFAEIAGFSKFGSYTGNGSADGPFVYCGFRPKYVLIKNSSTSGAFDWVVLDGSRDTYNVANHRLYPDLSASEDTYQQIDILSNGFKVRESVNGNINYNGGTNIYAAFAENPFKYSNAR